MRPAKEETDESVRLLQEKVRNMYASRAKVYDVLASSFLEDDAARRWLKDQFILIAMLKVPEQSCLLDLGTGTAAVLMLLARKYRTVIGLDLTFDMLHRAKTNLSAPQLSADSLLVQGSALVLPFPDGTFEAITCQRAFHHFPNHDAIVGEIYRVLRRNGQVIIGTAVMPEDPSSAQLTERIFRMLNPDYNRYPSLKEFSELFDSHGFTGFSHRSEIKKIGLDLLAEIWAPGASDDKNHLKQKVVAILNDCSDDLRSRVFANSQYVLIPYSVMQWRKE